jgi:SlyX protein
MQERITEIEIKVAHIEHSVAELSDVLYQQQGLIERLERICNELQGRLQDNGQPTGDNNPADEKPPHY